MLRNKLLITSIILSITGTCTYAETLSEIEIPKPPAYRVGISELPEKQYIQAEQKISVTEKQVAKIDASQEPNLSDMTYADLSIKRLSKEIAQDLEFEEKEMLADLSLLWQGAAVQSDTINFALYKLANPDADKPDEKSIKNVLKTIASMSTLVGASMGSPILAGSSIIGGNIFNIMSQDTKALNYKYTRVTDADMIILIRKVEDLQQKAVDLYYDYMSAKKQLEYANDLVEDREHKFNLAQRNNAPRELIVITDAYYRTAMDKQRNAKSEFFAKRAALEQFVGNETFLQFETELYEREKREKNTKNITSDTNQNSSNQSEQISEYQETINTVENFTNQLNSQTNTEIIVDKNMEKLPELRPLKEYDGFSESSFDNDPMRESLTGLSSNIEETNEEELGFWEKRKQNRADKKIKKEEEKALKIQQKKEKEENKKSRAERKLEAKDAKYSTKNLIFLHGEDKATAKRRYAGYYNPENNTDQTLNNIETNNVEVNSTQTYTQQPLPEPEIQPIQQTIPPSTTRYQQTDSLGLPPLDEIRVPELRKGGYSIHSDYTY